MITLVALARKVVPPQLEFVVLIYRPGEGPLNMTSVIYPRDGFTPLHQYERAKEAAQAFLVEKPHASFNPQN